MRPTIYAWIRAENGKGLIKSRDTLKVNEIRVDCAVWEEGRKGRGKLQIEFYNENDLQRILEILTNIDE